LVDSKGDVFVPGADGGGEVGADGEEIVEEEADHCANALVEVGVGENESQGGICLVDTSVHLKARVRF
jgi:hypothetical protein